MDNTRMGNADMIQYCDEALAWSDLGPIDIYFFQSVKNILLGKCSATEEPEDYPDDLMGIERPVRDVELEPEYGNFADIYYGEEGDDDIPNYSMTAEEEAFSDTIFSGGFFEDKEIADENNDETEQPENDEEKEEAPEEAAPAEKGDSFSVNI